MLHDLVVSLGMNTSVKGAGSQFEGRLRTLHHMPQCSHYGTEASDWFNPLELLAEGSSNEPALVGIDCHVSVICYCC